VDLVKFIDPRRAARAVPRVPAGQAAERLTDGANAVGDREVTGTRPRAAAKADPSQQTKILHVWTSLSV
jgi:hypothetical protein